MMALWMLYAIAVAALVAGAAAATERTLLLLGRPVRVGWVAALVASVCLPALALLLGSAPLQWTVVKLGQGAVAGSASAEGGLFRLSLSGAEEAVGTGSALLRSAARLARSLDGPLAASWGLLSLLVGGRLLRESWRLRQSRRTEWPSVREGPFRVLVAPATGPAVTGGLHPDIVVPSWFGELDEDLRRAALRHENEHRRAGDPWLLAAARGLLVVMPWNPALWWIVGRLRRAVELDCDRRVLRRGTDPATYGRLLIHVSRLSRGRRLLGAIPLGGKNSHLERRIRTMLNMETNWRTTKALAGIAVASLALVLACEAPPPGPPDFDGADGRIRVVQGQNGQTTLKDVSLTERPVVVVDGVVRASDASLAEINSLDIQRIEIIKGPAARERYGERGAEGVILIETRDGGS